MTLHSYPFIAVHYDNSEHTVESQGHTPGDAGKRLGLQDTRCKHVLDGSPPGHKNHRKPVWHRQGHEIDTPPSSETLLGQQMTHARTATATMLLESFERRGMTLYLTVEVEGDLEKISVGARPATKCTDADAQEINENQDSLIALLKEREASATPKESARKVRKAQRRTKFKFLREALSHLPASRQFQRYEIEQQLHKLGHHTLADDGADLTELLAELVLTGQMEFIREDVYRISGQQPLDIQTLNVIEDKAPAPEPEAPPAPPSRSDSPPVEAPEAVQEPLQAAPPTLPSPPSNGLSNPLEMMVGLVSALTADPINAEAIDAALITLSTDIMQAVENFEKVVRPMIQQARSQDNVRRNLRSQISSNN